MAGAALGGCKPASAAQANMEIRRPSANRAAKNRPNTLTAACGKCTNIHVMCRCGAAASAGCGSASSFLRRSKHGLGYGQYWFGAGGKASPAGSSPQEMQTAALRGEAVKKLGQAPRDVLITPRNSPVCSEPVPFFHSLEADGRGVCRLDSAVHLVSRQAASAGDGGAGGGGFLDAPGGDRQGRRQHAESSPVWHPVFVQTCPRAGAANAERRAGEAAHAVAGGAFGERGAAGD
jgi:hypothetical protein